MIVSFFSWQYINTTVQILDGITVWPSEVLEDQSSGLVYKVHQTIESMHLGWLATLVQFHSLYIIVNVIRKLRAFYHLKILFLLALSSPLKALLTAWLSKITSLK